MSLVQVGHLLHQEIDGDFEPVGAGGWSVGSSSGDGSIRHVRVGGAYTRFPEHLLAESTRASQRMLQTGPHHTVNLLVPGEDLPQSFVFGDVPTDLGGRVSRCRDVVTAADGAMYAADMDGVERRTGGGSTNPRRGMGTLMKTVY